MWCIFRLALLCVLESVIDTLQVRHLHWYKIGEKVSICECRCSRAKLPPSKYVK